MQQLYCSGNLGQDTPTGDEPTVATESRVRRPSEHRVLVVDDDDGVRTVVTRALEGAGLTVFAATDGLKALELLEVQEAGIDLVLTDLSMPRLGGIALGREIAGRQLPIAVLYMSANPPEGLVSDGGASKQCLLKPFSMTALLATVGQLLAW